MIAAWDQCSRCCRRHVGALITCLIVWGTLSTAPAQPPGTGGRQQHSVRQTWPQEPAGFERGYVVQLPRVRRERWPVIVVLHGNGGQAERAIVNWPARHPDCLVVAPQGYQRSWNITRERSKAPDVAFITAMLADVQQRYPQADCGCLSLVGFSNGAALVYALLIEWEATEAAAVRSAVAVVSSMTTDQFHDGKFWKRSDASSADYDTPLEPACRCPLLTIHGTADTVVPYGGGRGPGGIHLSAQESAHAWANARGFPGAPIPDTQGERIAGGLLRYTYPKAGVTHLKIPGGRHGLGPAHRVIDPLIDAFLQEAFFRDVLRREGTTP